MEEDKDNGFIILWDMFGLESIIPVDVTQYRLEEEQRLLDVLSDITDRKYYQDKISSTIRMLTLRARMNNQRSYELYFITTSADFTKQYIEKLFKESPQLIVDLIREKGQKIYSGRSTQKQIIT